MLAAASILPSDDVSVAFHALVDRGRYEIPVFPRVAQQVLELSSDCNAGATQVARCIERDPSLCASVLGGAGSALYGGRSIRSIKQAVALLGMNEVVLLATAAALRSSVVRPGPFLPLLTEAWRLGLAAGLFAKEVARARRANVDTAFLCGLLHAIGRPIGLGLLISIDGAADIELASARTIVADYEVRLGCEAVRGWGLPASVEATIAALRSSEPPPTFADEVHTVKLSVQLAAWLLEGDDGARQVLVAELDAAPSLTPLNLYPDDIGAILQRAPLVMDVLESVT